MKLSQVETTEKKLLKISLLVTILISGVISCGKNFTTTKASTDISPLSCCQPPANDLSALKASSSNQKDGTQYGSFTKTSTPNSQFAHFKLSGFNPNNNTIYGCLNYNNTQNCNLASSFAQIYPAVSNSGWVMDGTVLRSTYDLSTIAAGTYNFVFRKDRVDNVGDDQASITVTIYAAASPNPDPNPGSSDFTNLGVRGNSNFQQLFAPGAPAISAENGVYFMNPFMGSSDGSMRITKFKVFLPPGTVNFQGTAFLYVNSQGQPAPAKAAIRWNKAPITTASQIQDAADANGANSSMQGLLQGSDLRFLSGGGSIGLTPGAAFGQSQPSYKLTQGGYVYIDILDAPGKVIMTMNINIQVDQTCYDSWFAHAKFDSTGNPSEAAVHTCAGSQ